MTVQHHPKEDETLLAKSYKNLLQVVKTPPTRTTWLVLVVVLLAAVLIGSWFYFTSVATASSSGLWLEWLEKSESGSAALDKFGQDAGQQNSVQARFAQAEAADRRMQEAVAKLGFGPGRAEAVEQIARARDAYEKLVRESGDNPALLEQSLMGAAKANETLGDLGKAKTFYQQLARDYPNTTLGKEADARAKALDDENTKKEIETLAAEFAPPVPAK